MKKTLISLSLAMLSFAGIAHADECNPAVFNADFEFSEPKYKTVSEEEMERIHFGHEHDKKNGHILGAYHSVILFKNDIEKNGKCLSKYNVTVNMTPTIFISETVKNGTCKYDAVVAHELTHYRIDRKHTKEVILKTLEDMKKFESYYIKNDEAEYQLRMMFSKRQMLNSNDNKQERIEQKAFDEEDRKQKQNDPCFS